LVTEAELAVKDAYFEAAEGLTEGERLQVAVSVFSSIVSSIARYAIREERHPEDLDYPGGLE